MILKLKPQRPLKNLPEQALIELAAGKGWAARKRGWPDFWCLNEDETEIIVVECKPRLASGRLQLLKKEQAVIMNFLSSKGIRCFISDGEKLEPYDHAKQIETRRQSAIDRKKRL